MSLGAAAALTLSIAAVPSPVVALDDVNSQQLRKRVDVGGIMSHERVFQRIANQNGGTRASGTPGYDASAEVRRQHPARCRLHRAQAGVHLPVLPRGRSCGPLPSVA